MELTSVSCTAQPPTDTTAAVNTMCSFPIAQDGVFERNEYVVIVLTVTDDGGNTIVNTARNCAIGRILQNESPGN